MKPRAKDSVLQNIIGGVPQPKLFVKAKQTRGACTLAKITKVEVVKPSRARISNDQLNDMTRVVRKLLIITWLASMSLGLFIGWALASKPLYTAYENGVRSGQHTQGKPLFTPTP